jgi:hypothetical protein
MMIIAAGLRQTHTDINGDKFVLFDQGIYKVPPGAKTKKIEGADWIFCEAHADENTGEGFADIGGVRMKLVYDPDASGDD